MPAGPLLSVNVERKMKTKLTQNIFAPHRCVHLAVKVGLLQLERSAVVLDLGV